MPGINGERMSAPHVVIQADRKSLSPIAMAAPRTAWRIVGWFGLLFSVIGISDIALQWYPFAFRSTEWEFGTVATTAAAMPLLSLGLIMLFSAALALGSRSGVTTMAVVFLILAVLLLGAFLLFLSDVPVALNSPAGKGPAGMMIKKTIIRTSVMSLGYAIAFVCAAVVSFRFLFRRIKDV
jgi:hypothetical protein